MKKIIGLIMITGISYGASVVTPPGIQVNGLATNNNVMVYSNGMLLDSGVAPTNLVSVTNLTADIEELQANSIDSAAWASVSNAAYSARTSVMPGLRLFLNNPKLTSGIGVVTDSTGIGQYWPYKLLETITNELGSAYTVNRYWWDWTNSVVEVDNWQVGTNGTEFSFQVTNSPCAFLMTTDGIMPADDIEIVMHTKLQDWTPSANKWLTYCFNGAVWNHSIRLLTSGNLWYYYSQDNITQEIFKANAATGLSDGDVNAMFKITVDVATGSGNTNGVANFYWSTNGTSWTQIGTAVTNAGAISLGDEATYGDWGDVYIGNSSTGMEIGDVLYDFEWRNGIDGAPLSPPMEGWRISAPENAIITNAAPEFNLYNFAWSGGEMADSDISDYRKMFPAWLPGIIFAMSHNEMGKLRPNYTYIYNQLDGEIAELRDSARAAQIVVMSQNPISTEWPDPYRIDRTPLFFGHQLQAAKSQGYEVIDAYSFMLNNGFENDWLGDGLHPTPTTQQFWADYIWSRIYVDTPPVVWGE